MHPVLHFKDRNIAEYLNTALRRHGLDSHVFNTGLSPEGDEMFSITCLESSELKLARHLIYSSRYFLNDIHPEAASELREIRKANRRIFLDLVKSRPAIIISILAMSAAALGYIFDL
ncbi:hypothetical protein E8E95_07385 [Pseudomonas sp. BN414]|uniref:hypothetical protein n=1 Tax=Pseudomonas sp. BN414 TaxID=2567888 RepID=UPI002458D02A|nr:hypothetical protein [Pseudomonas sp. BN414]MDH4566497.1 hypothetical protein [Pseudomonas sp. BN414]